MKYELQSILSVTVFKKFDVLYHGNFKPELASMWILGIDIDN